MANSHEKPQEYRAYTPEYITPQLSAPPQYSVSPWQAPQSSSTHPYSPQSYSDQQYNIEFDLEVDTFKEVISEVEDEVLKECPKFRILIIGQAGVGKSTICSKVFNVSGQRAGVSHKERGQSVQQVWQEITFPGQNENIILHDSGGFEAGDKGALEEIQAFIKNRREQPKLADQLHCIWYCISCESSRPFQSAEESFFTKIDKGQIPVVAVFTQFDLLVDKHFNKWRRDYRKSHPRETTIPTEEGEHMARLLAGDDYETNYRNALLKRIGLHSGVGILRLALPEASEDEEMLNPYEAYGEARSETGINELIRTTLDHLTIAGLKILWTAAQRLSADIKLQESIKAGMKTFWSVMGTATTPFTTLLGATMIYRAFDRILSSVSRVWGIEDPYFVLRDKSTRNAFLEGCFDVSIWRAIGTFGGMGVFSLVTLNIAGPLTASASAIVVMKMIAGCTLMFEQLFWIQREHKGEAMSRARVQEVVNQFRKSPGRKIMASHIDGTVDLGNCYSKKAVRKTLDMAVELARSQKAREYTAPQTIA